MIREIAHFLSNLPELMRLQKQLARAEFIDVLNAKVDAHGFADVRRELVTGAIFQYYGDGVELDAIEPDRDVRALAVTKAKSACLPRRSAC